MKPKREEFAHQYNAEVQRIFLSIMAGDVTLFAKCRTIIQDEYFDDQFRPTVRYMLEHADTYRAIPTIDMIAAKTGISLSPISAQQIELQGSWFCDDFEGFCRYRAMENVILDGVDLLQAGKADEVSQRVKEALTIRLMSDLGTDYFDDPETRLKRLLDTSATVSTGWTALDEKLFGGFVRGGLNIFLGNSGSGKSLVLQNLALNWVLNGFNVIYFTLELAEDRTSLKIDAMLTGKGTRDVVRQISDSALMVKMRSKKAGRLFIKKYPGGGTNCNDLRSYLKEYEIINQFPPDAIIIDYLDLMHPNAKGIDLSNLHIKDKFVSEEIRALMHETNTFGATASQLTRCVSLDTEVIERFRGSIRIADLAEGDHIVGSSGFVNVIKILPAAKQKAFMVKTRSGKSIICSRNHKFPTTNGLRSIEDGLNVGDILKTAHCHSENDVVFSDDEIIEIVEISETELIDIEVDGDHLFLANGILTHNSSIETLGEFDQSHTAGGISKINTCDNAIALYAPPQFKERGEFEFIFLKTRESTGVGHRLKLGYDNTCMRISDRVITTKDVDKPSSYDELRKELLTKMDNSAPTETVEEKPEEPDYMKRLNGLMSQKRAATD